MRADDPALRVRGHVPLRSRPGQLRRRRPRRGVDDPDRSEVKSLIKEHGDKIISEVTVTQAYGGMRRVKAQVCDKWSL